jgi:hypothetical protein
MRGEKRDLEGGDHRSSAEDLDWGALAQPFFTAGIDVDRRARYVCDNSRAYLRGVLPEG